jgi:hypothetical protein
LFFDTDSYEIKLDTGCSYSLSGTEADFLPGTAVPAEGMSIGVFGGAKIHITGIGTLKWTILDDVGRTLVLIIPNSLYVKGTTTRLLSPQHYGQVGQVPGSAERVQFSTVIGNNCFEMIWNNPHANKAIELDNAKIGTIFSKPGYASANTFFACANDQHNHDDTNNCCYQCTFEADVFNASKIEGKIQSDSSMNDNTITDKGTIFEKAEKMRETPIVADISQDIFHNTVRESGQLETMYDNESHLSDLLLLLHYKFGHVPMKRLQRLAERGELPKHSRVVRFPYVNPVFMEK